jgi:hypothetical protein
MSTLLSSTQRPPSWKPKLNAPSTKVREPFGEAGTVELSHDGPHPPAERASKHDPQRNCSCGGELPAQQAADPGPAVALTPGARVAVFLLSAYKSFVSPLLPSSCKFYPTCSQYAKEAVERYGVARGLGLGLRRLLRCRPFSPGGYDPVPDA